MEKNKQPPPPPPPPPQAQQNQKCPRCDSVNTKFCYYNNYSLSQPRYYCKGCKRYWTQGGTLRNIPVGGASRKGNKRPKTCSSSSSTPLGSSQPHPPALVQSQSNLTTLMGPPVVPSPGPHSYHAYLSSLPDSAFAAPSTFYHDHHQIGPDEASPLQGLLIPPSSAATSLLHDPASSHVWSTISTTTSIGGNINSDQRNIIRAAPPSSSSLIPNHYSMPPHLPGYDGPPH